MTRSKNRRRVYEEPIEEEESTKQNWGKHEKVPGALGMWDQNETYAQRRANFNDSDHFLSRGEKKPGEQIIKTRFQF